MPLTEQQCPWTGPYALPENPAGNPSKGPTCEALKRALSRAGAPSLPWRDFDQHYNEALEEAWDWYDKRHGAGADNNGYGKGRWNRLRGMMADPQGEHKGEYALDRYGRELIQNEAGHTADSTDMERFQQYCVEFCRIALANGGRWDYNAWIRPVRLNQDPANPTGTSDCSGSVIQITDYARRKANLMERVQDPSKQNWSGYGNTDQYEDNWPKIGPPYRVGDLAHYQNSRHVTFCMKPGDRSTAEWWSFGREPPVAVSLATYRTNDLLYVVRPIYFPLPV